MPFDKNNPPEKIKGLPDHAKHIWIAAFNSAYEQYKDDGKAHATAWAAVKKAGYTEDSNGTWHKASEATRTDMDETETKQDAVLREEDGHGGHLVIDKDGNKHLPTEKNGKTDHGLMGAAWAALHGGYRGNKYEGPDKDAAIAKLKAKYKAEGLPLPGEKEEECTTDEKECTAKEALDTSQAPQLMQPTEHEHEHMHGTFKHSHPHQHDKEHGIDQMLSFKHDHPHPDEENPAEQKKEKPADEKKEDKAEPKKEAVRTMVFGELAYLKESVVDKTKKTVEVTLIKPGWSANGRYYGREVLAKAVPCFEGAKAYADHPSMDEEKNRPERSVLDITGYYTNVRQVDDGSLKATRHFVGKGERDIWPLVVETVTNKPDLIGISINALGHTEMGEAEGREGVIVSEIARAFSADDVTVASAGGRYERLMQSGDEMTEALLKSLTYEEWRKANPDFEARIKKEMRTARKDELASETLKEAETLKAQLSEQDRAISAYVSTIEQLKEAAKRLETKLADQEHESAIRVSEVLADYKLLASKLPKPLCEATKPQLVGKTPEVMDQLIEAERKKYFAVVEPVTVQNAGQVVVDESRIIDPEQEQVLDALGIQESILPRAFESPEAYARRKQTRK